jgi:Zn-dependent peptidase ImmA (M78 family)/DNA-binding XRE family transcriptional regulator
MSAIFNPKRLTLARHRRRLTKIQLAVAIGVSPYTVQRYESGSITPSEDSIARIAETLEFPDDFFFGPDIDELSGKAASFRSQSAMTARERNAALAAGSIAYLFSDWMHERFDLPQPDLIDLSAEEPEGAACSLRQKWLLGEQPIKHMVRLLEAKGVRVFSLSENTKTVDAFSAWRGDQPFVFLNTAKSAEHGRYDAAHELGHLVLHRHGGPQGRKAEEDANRFAASFLMPSSDVRATLPRVNSLKQIIQGKKRWGVSVAALNYRLHKLGITSDWLYRTFCIQLTELGFRDNEPYGMKREQSIVWQKTFTELWKEKATKREVANALNLPFEEINNLLFGLEPQTNTDMEEAPSLRLA